MDTAYVYTMKELKDAVKQKRERIVVRGKLAKTLKPLAKIKGAPNVHEGMSTDQLAGTLATAAVPAAVWITLIVVVGITVFVALIRGYNVKVKVGENLLIFDQK
ncbi:MAG: hypothetical protein GX072_07310 [Lysinibacillus sp.]|nr:hypothetical protein [Lysinibacillus sp.]